MAQPVIYSTLESDPDLPEIVLFTWTPRPAPLSDAERAMLDALVDFALKVAS